MRNQDDRNILTRWRAAFFEKNQAFPMSFSGKNSTFAPACRLYTLQMSAPSSSV